MFTQDVRGSGEHNDNQKWIHVFIASYFTCMGIVFHLYHDYCSAPESGSQTNGTALSNNTDTRCRPGDVLRGDCEPPACGDDVLYVLLRYQVFTVPYCFFLFYKFMRCDRLSICVLPDNDKRVRPSCLTNNVYMFSQIIFSWYLQWDALVYFVQDLSDVVPFVFLPLCLHELFYVYCDLAAPKIDSRLQMGGGEALLSGGDQTLPVAVPVTVTEVTPSRPLQHYR